MEIFLSLGPLPVFLVACEFYLSLKDILKTGVERVSSKWSCMLVPKNMYLSFYFDQVPVTVSSALCLVLVFMFLFYMHICLMRDNI